MKEKRQNAICQIIAKKEIETQQDLAAELKKIGFEVTQATISRDIRELGLTKIVKKSGKSIYFLNQPTDPSQEKVTARRYNRVMQEGYIDSQIAGYLVVVKTMIGMASGVAAAIDSLKMEGVVATLAGVDTLFIAVKTKEDGELLQKKIQEMII